MWLSSIKPQNIVYDIEHDEYRDVRWNEQPDQLAQERKDRRIEEDEVQKRMTASVLPEMDGGDLDGSDDDSFYSIDEDFEDEDEEESEMMFFDAASAMSPRSSRAGSRPNSLVAEVFAQSDLMTDDFQSCRGSISESTLGSDQVGITGGDDNIGRSPSTTSLPIPVPVPVPVPMPPQTNEIKKNEPDKFESEVIEKATLSRSAKKLLSMGNHIRDTNVFLLERLSNRTVLAIMTVYYSTFCVLIVYSLVFVYNESERTDQVAIVPGLTNSSAGGGYNETEYICFPRPQVNDTAEKPVPSPEVDVTKPTNGTCVANTAITVGEAVLLANTVVVSEGIEVSDWRGNGALPGTLPFFAQSVTPPSSFIVDASVLDYDANPELHANWEDISAAIWYGYSPDSKQVTQGITQATLTWQFQRTDGQSWPDDTDNYPFPVNAHLYACTRGANCCSVGDYRQQLLQPAFGPSYIIYPRQSLDATGLIYSIAFDMPNSLVASDAIQAWAWRFVLHSDPNGAISSCLSGDDRCIINTSVRSARSDSRVMAIINAIFLVFYTTFFLWWIVTLLIFNGWPWTWPVEQRWLLMLGFGLSFYNNIYSVALEVAASYRDSYIFDEIHWFASTTCAEFGNTLILFSLAVFADSPRHFVVPFTSFYWPKMCYCFVYFLSMTVALLWRYPQLTARDQPGSDTKIGGLGFVTSPISWPVYDKIVVTGASLVASVCIGLGFIYYIVRCLLTQRVLSTLPYNMTRPVQIAFRFFISATAIWIFAELIMFTLRVLTGIIKTLQYDGFETDAPLFDRVITGLDELQFFTKDRSPVTVVFGAIFIAIFQFLFSPPSALGPVKAKKTHYMTEKEANEAKTKGRLGFRVPSNLMILERARLLVICSREVYLPFEDEFDKESDRDKIDLEAGTPNKRTTPRSPRGNPLADSFIPIDLNPNLVGKARIAGFRFGIEGRPVPKGSAFGAGCRAVAYISEPKGLNVHDTRALLLRHEPSGALILSFRGTASMKHVKTDLMTHKVRVSLDTFLAIPSKREQARRLVHSIVPDAVEKNLLAGGKEKVVIYDLLHVDGEELPDYLQSSIKSNEEIPGLGVGRLHFGFYSSYCRVRKLIHQRVRQELTLRPGPLYITGHSLGGCLATVCAYDAARWVLPTVENDLRKLGRPSEADKLTLSMYSYGAPRPGDRLFARAYDRLVKDTQRVVCDGDVITSGMPTWMNYAHVGMEDIFDYTGSIRVNPSVVEKATLKKRNSPERHLITNYAKVIKLARQPAISVLDLHNLLRDAYGIERIVEDEKKREKAAKRKRKKVEPPEQASPTRQDVPSAPPPLIEPRSNAFDILYG